MASTVLRQPKPRYASDLQRWRAVLARDRQADGAFVFAVRTTGVFCRPSCPARRPNRDNVLFFAGPDSALRSGYRACKRCRPAESVDGSPHATAVAAACRLLERQGDAASLQELAAQAGLSPWHFQRTFKALTGVTPKAYAAAVRAGRLRQALASEPSVTDAALAAGFASHGRLYNAAPGALGMSPRQFQRGGTGTAIRYSLGRSWLGHVLVAATDRGVCWLALGDDRDDLQRELRQQFPQAKLGAGDAKFVALIKRAIRLIERPEHSTDLPLDIQGTAFQCRVWQALREIPAGVTLTYTELARQLGRPRSVRAVASACAANKLAVAVPCHRVVRSDGGLAGYRWGVERKRKLLRRERGER